MRTDEIDHRRVPAVGSAHGQAGAPLEAGTSVRQRSTPTSPGHPSWGAPLAVLIVGMFMSILDTTIVNIAITDISKSFGATITDTQWISTAYGVTEGAVVPVSAWLSHRVGHKRLFIIGVAGFTLFSLLCGLSTSLPEMIVFRILQAIPGGMIPVTCITMIYTLVPAERIGTAMGLYGLGVTMAPGAGPAIGGYLVEFASWPWIYWVNVPIGIVAVAAAVVVLPGEAGERGNPLDKLGLLCIVTGLFSLLLAVEEGSTWGWGSYSVLALLALGTNMLALWVIVELRSDHPMLDLRAFRSVTFVKSLALIGVLFCGSTAQLFNIPQFLQSVQGRTPSHTGLVTLPYAMVLMVMMPLAGRIYDAFGARWPATIGLITTASGLFLLSGITPDTPIPRLITAQCTVGLGMGLSMMPIMTGGLSSLTAELNDSGGAFNTLFQRMSQAFSTALLTSMITTDKAQSFADRSLLLNSDGADADPTISKMIQSGGSGLEGLWQQTSNAAQTDAYRQAFLLTAAVVLLGAFLAVTLPTKRSAARALTGGPTRSERDADLAPKALEERVDDQPPATSANSPTSTTRPTARPISRGRTHRPARRSRTRATRVGFTVIAVVAAVQSGALGTRYLLTDYRWIITDNAQVDGDALRIDAPASGPLKQWNLTMGSEIRPRERVGQVAIGNATGPDKPIHSPGEGTVAENFVSPGTWVTEGALLAVAYAPDASYVTARVSDSQIAGVHPGATVDISVDADPGVPVTGVVTDIGAATAGVDELNGSPETNPLSHREPIWPGPDTDPQNPQRVEQYVPVTIRFTSTGSATISPGQNVTVHIHR